MLLFICRTRRTWNISRSVSIHLILLFIEETGSAEKKLQPFQYISCYSLSSMGYPLVLVALWVSIHLMLLFIDQQQDDSIPYCAFQYISCYSLSRCRHRCCYIRSVSIHLMLLFIKLGYEDSDIELGFNTSHVTLYQYKACKLHIRPERFNTSHVTLYLEGETDGSNILIRFNTSHVTLYRKKRVCKDAGRILFQYISCYSLSY